MFKPDLSDEILFVHVGPELCVELFTAFTRGNEQAVVELLEAANEDLNDYEKRLVRLEEKLAQLPEKQREVLVKCVVEGKKYKEVAEELDITVNTVKTHITRALKFLRGELQEDLIMLLLCLRRI